MSLGLKCVGLRALSGKHSDNFTRFLGFHTWYATKVPRLPLNSQLSTSLRRDISGLLLNLFLWTRVSFPTLVLLQQYYNNRTQCERVVFRARDFESFPVVQCYDPMLLGHGYRLIERSDCFDFAWDGLESPSVFWENVRLELMS